eukprot:678545-Prorocentrum_minimum.AAC.3
MAPTTEGHSRSLLFTLGHAWSLLVTLGHSWPLSVTLGHSRPLSARSESAAVTTSADGFGRRRGWQALCRLIELGAKINAAGAAERRVVHLAVLVDNLQLVGLLANEYGVNLEAKDEVRCTRSLLLGILGVHNVGN